MIKRLALMCCLLAGSAQAEEWMETPNEAGGRILFLSAKCADKDGRMVISTMPGGDTVHGCWYFFSDMVHVIWTDARVRGKTSAFDLSGLTYRTTEAK